MSVTEIHVNQILPGTSYQLVGTNSGATKDVYLTLSGTSNQISVGTAGTTITLSTPQNIDSTATPTFASETLTATTNQLILGNTHTTTISSTAPSGSRVYTIPDAGATSNFVLDQGNYTIGGTWTFSNTITVPQINTASGSKAIDLSVSTGRQLVTSAGTVVEDWQNLTLNTSGGTSVDWGNRALKNTTGSTVLNWATTGALSITPTTTFANGIILTGVTSDPVSPTAGQIWFRSDTSQFVGYNGSTNVIIG